MPKLSIIVCTYNREKYIGKTLELLGDQSVDKNLYEVLIIDNNSTDSTAIICRQFIGGPNGSNCKYYIEEQQGHTFARNRGIIESKGEYIAFLDDDAWANRVYCEELIRFLDHNPEAAAIGGKISPVYESIEPRWMSRHLWPLVAGLDLGSSVKEFRRNKYPIGANMAFRSSVFKDYGHFNTRLGRRGKELEGGDEKDMVYRLKKDHKKILYVPSVHVQHVIPDSRTSIDYIKGQAIGVGTSEKKRLKDAGTRAIIKKIIEEIIKIGGTFILAFFYLLILKPQKGIMLIRFRIWVLRGFLSKNQS